MDFKKIMQLKLDLEEEVRKESVKAKGLKMDSAIKKMFKKCSNDRLENTSFSWRDKRTFTDGYRMYILNDDYGYVKAEDDENSFSFAVNKILDGLDTASDIEIKVDIQDLTSFYKIAKAEKRVKDNPYILEKDGFRIGFNSEYLYEALTSLKTDAIYCSKSVAPAVTNRDFTQEFALILPIQIKE